MTPYRAQHDALFRSVAEIIVRDYIAPSETADTVAEWCQIWGPPKCPRCKGKGYVLGGTDRYGYPVVYKCSNCSNGRISKHLELMEPSELAALIADVEGYKKR